MSPLAYPQADADAEKARTLFQWTGGAEYLVDPPPPGPWVDGHTRHYLPDRTGDVVLPWVWRYGTASAGTGSRYAALATLVHPDIASREGGPVLLTVLSPWQDSHAFALHGWLDESYVAEHLTAGRIREGRLHAGDLAALTMLLRLLLGRDPSEEMA